MTSKQNVTICTVIFIAIFAILIWNEDTLIFTATNYPIGTSRNLCDNSPESLYHDINTLLPIPNWMNVRHLRNEELSYPIKDGQHCSFKYPIIMEPRNITNSTDNNDINRLKLFLSVNSDALYNVIQHFGAILFRGWNIGVTESTKYVSNFLDDSLKMDITTTRGYINSRPHINNTHFINVARYPSGFILMPHIELCNRNNRPKVLAFYVNATSDKFGETPLIHFGNVWKSLSRDIQIKFDTKNVLFINNLPSESASVNFDTNNSKIALEICNKLNNNQCRFISHDNSLQFHAFIPGTIIHPLWNEKVLSTSFNSWNPYFQILTHLKVFNHRFTFWEKIKIYFYFKWYYHINNKVKTMFASDQSMLSLNEIQKMVQSLWNNAVIYKPQKNDIIIIDNIGIAHARLNIAGHPNKRSQLAYIAGQYTV